MDSKLKIMKTIEDLIKEHQIENNFQTICEYPVQAKYAKNDKYYFIILSFPDARELFFKGGINTTTQNVFDELSSYYCSLPESWLYFAPPKEYKKKAICEGLEYLVTHHKNFIEINSIGKN